MSVQTGSPESPGEARPAQQAPHRGRKAAASGYSRRGQTFSTSSRLPPCRGEREAQVRPDLRPHQGQKPMTAAPHRDQHPPKCTGTPFLRGGCQTSPFSPPTPPAPLRLAWGALTCHAASLGQGGLLPTCREENRRVTDSFHFQPSFKAQTPVTQDQTHAESMVLSAGPTTDPSPAVPLQRAKDSSCLPALHLPGGAQGTLSSQSAGAGPTEKQGPCRPAKWEGKNWM